MTDYVDYMVDVETTGFGPDVNAVIQISALRFSLKDRTIDTANFFNSCLLIPRNRYWDIGTRQFWAKREELYRKIEAQMRPPQEVMKEFVTWVWSDGVNIDSRRVWARNAAFDISMLEGYHRQFDTKSPFHYRKDARYRHFP